jgi:hypothetical protein
MDERDPQLVNTVELERTDGGIEIVLYGDAPDHVDGGLLVIPPGALPQD